MPTYKEIRKQLKKVNATFVRQGKGSHEVWEYKGKKIIVANHKGKEMPIGTFKKIMKQLEE